MNTKPLIVDPSTGELFKKNKWLRGVIGEAGIFLGQHLEGDTFVVTEGVEDALCAVMAGIPAVAKMGAQNLEKLTLPAHVKRVILAGDNDEPGQAGVNKAAKSYCERGLSVATVKLPDGVNDLNDVLSAHDVEAVRRCLPRQLRGTPPPRNSRANVRPTMPPTKSKGRKSKGSTR